MIALFVLLAGLLLGAPLIYYVIGFVCFWLEIALVE